MKIKNLFPLILLLLIPITTFSLEESGIIYNSTVESEQRIALGIRKEGQMGAYNPNIAQNSNYTGIAFKFDGSKSQGYKSGWYDANTPGCLCEGWGIGFRNSSGINVPAYVNVGQIGRPNINSSGIYQHWGSGEPSIKAKSFVRDETSITSTVWVHDRGSREEPMFEITQRYGPAENVPGVLFQALVTITNISGATRTGIYYNRTMDWDVHPTEFNELVTIKGVQASRASESEPRVHVSGNNGFMAPNVYSSWSAYTKYPKDGEVNKDYESAGPADQGFTSTFALGDLACGEAHTFMIYYGAAENKVELEEAFATEGVPIYSIGQSSDRDRKGNIVSPSDVSYGFGFKGLSGSAIAPLLPTKIASLPGGAAKNSGWHTYAPPVLSISGDSLYQAKFAAYMNKQWKGEIVKYGLDKDGAIIPGRIAEAEKKLKKRLDDVYPNLDKNYENGGRSIWTVGNDPNCPEGLLTKPSTNNNFTTANIDKLEKILLSCNEYTGPEALNATNLIRFVRGASIHGIDYRHRYVRPYVLGDTYHSELVFVGPPGAIYSTDASNFSKTEAHFRSVNGYGEFSQTNNSRRSQLYAGANDGMLHAFDEDLNERWAFIPPSVTPKLRDMLGNLPKRGDTVTKRYVGESNSVFSVDGPIAVKDIYIHATKEWKTVLVGGLGYGGKSYYVLDITDPDDPQHMFTISNNDSNKTVNYWAADGTKSSYPYLSAPDHIDYQKLGNTWSRPSIMLIPYQSTDGKTKQRWAMVFGGGFGGGASSGFGPYVFTLDFEPDTTLSPNTSGGKIISVAALTPDPSSNIPNGATAHMSVVSADGTELANYYGGIAYFTDLQGQLWKYNLSKTSLDEDNDNLFDLNLAYRAEGTLANDRFGYNQVATTIVQDDGGGNILFNYFGTGDLSRIQRRDPAINNRIFGIRDADFPNSGLAVSGIGKDASTSQNIDDAECISDIKQNWYANTDAVTTLAFRGTAIGENTKVVGRAALYNKSIFYSIYQPEAIGCPVYGASQIIEIKDGCGGVSQYDVGEGMITAPVADDRGNVYVGVGNLRRKSGRWLPIGGDGTENVTRIGTGEDGSSEAPSWKSWREITY